MQKGTHRTVLLKARQVFPEVSSRRLKARDNESQFLSSFEGTMVTKSGRANSHWLQHPLQSCSPWINQLCELVSPGLLLARLHRLTMVLHAFCKHISNPAPSACDEDSAVAKRGTLSFMSVLFRQLKNIIVT